MPSIHISTAPVYWETEWLSLKTSAYILRGKIIEFICRKINNERFKLIKLINLKVWDSNIASVLGTTLQWHSPHDRWPGDQVLQHCPACHHGPDHVQEVYWDSKTVSGHHVHRVTWCVPASSHDKVQHLTGHPYLFSRVQSSWQCLVSVTVDIRHSIHLVLTYPCLY